MPDSNTINNPFLDDQTSTKTGAQGGSKFDPSTAKPVANTAPGSNNKNTKFDPSTAKAVDKGFGGHVRDLGASLMGGLASVPDVAVGVADLYTGGRAGKAVDNLSENFKLGEGQKYWQDKKTDHAKVQSQEFSDAEGIVDKTKVALSNPSMIANTVVESLPSMALGGLAGRGLNVASKGLINPVAAGAAGEGLVMAGGQAEQIRQQTDDELLTGGQVAAAAATGVAGSALGYLGGRLAQKLGLADVDTLMASGVKGQVLQEAAQEIPLSSIPKAVALGAISEGLFEEMPQSVTETVMQNVALDKPWHEGLDDAIVMGTLAGTAMGGTVAGASKASQWANQPKANKTEDSADTDTTGTNPMLPTPTGGNGGLTGLGYDGLQGEYIPAGAQAADQTAPVRQNFEYDQMQTDADNQLQYGGQSRQYAPTPSQQMGIDPNAGPLSTAAATAVDNGISQSLTPALETNTVADAKKTDTTDSTAQTESTVVPSDYRELLSGQNEQNSITKFNGSNSSESSNGRGQSEIDQSGISGTDTAGMDGGGYNNGSDNNQGTVVTESSSNDGSHRAATPIGSATGLGGEGNTEVDSGAQAKQGGDYTNTTGQTPDVPATKSDFAAGDVQAKSGVIKESPQGLNNTAEIAQKQLADVDTQISDIEQQLVAEKSVPKKLQMRKQLDSLKAQRGEIELQHKAIEQQTKIENAAHEAASSTMNDLPEPTPAQIEAGNYKKGHIKVHGLDIAVENPRGSERRGTDPDGKEWAHEMSDHYGYIKRTIGADNEHIDTYVGRNPESEQVFIVDQIDQKTGDFDEHKVMMGFSSQEEAIQAYSSNFDKGWKVGPVRAMNKDEFKTWLKDGNTKKPAGEGVNGTLTNEGTIQLQGKTEKVYTPGTNREIEVRHKVVEADSLITSNDANGAVNPNFPQHLQPRDRSRPTSIAQVHDIASNLNPKLLGENPSTASGAPIVSAEGVVESGNGRTMAIRKAYEQGKGEVYRKWLSEQGHDVAGMKNPVLVRERTTPMSDQELLDYTKESNESTTLTMSPTEQAMVDAKAVVDLLDQYRGGDINSAANRDFVNRFVTELVPTSERGKMLSAGTGLTQDGQRRINAALVAAAYNDTFIVDQVFESTESDIKAIGNALTDVAGFWAKMRDMAINGQIPKDLDVTPNLVEAVHLVQKARVTSTKLADLVAQDDIFSGAVDPVTLDFLSVFYRGDKYTRARGRERVADALNHYAQQAMQQSNGENLFGDKPKNNTQLRGETLDRLDQQETDKQQDIFASPQPDDRNTVTSGGTGQRATTESSDAETQTTEVKSNSPEKPDSSKPAATKPKEVIQDFGEKIGGARKDTAVKTGKKPVTEKPKDDRPTWAKRFEISEIAASSNPAEVGKWTISDTKNKDWMGNNRRLTNQMFNSQEEAEKFLPVAAVAMKHRVTTDTKDGKKGYIIVRTVSDRKHVQVVQQLFDTRDAANEYLVRHAQEILETNTTFGELDLPRPENTQRTGVARREGDAKDSDFSRVFGFRGVEFGNWNNQEERQELLNDAFDGLMDLAEVLNIPPEALSLNGELALAFGARGQGLSSAKAHYESNRVVINLTKMNGAGSLAHEWWHAFDHYLSRQDGSASSAWIQHEDGSRSLNVKSNPADLFASHGFKVVKSGVREDVRNNFEKLMVTMFKKSQAYIEDTQAADEFVARSRDEVQDKLNSIRENLTKQLDPQYYKRFNKPASADQLAEFDTAAELIITGQLLETEARKNPKSRSTFGGYRHTNDALDKINEIFKAVRGRSGFNADFKGVLDYLRGSMSRYMSRLKMLADAQQSTTKYKSVPTEFAMNAKELDQGRGSDYWTTPHEMSARAFQGYVEDKIAAKNARSPFLNYGPENVGILTPYGVKRPFPYGEERVAINQAFDDLIGGLQTEKTETGQRLYSRAQNNVQSGQTPEQVREALVKRFGEKTISSLERRGLLDIVSTVDEPGVEGFYQNGRVTLVANNLNETSIIPTFLHELGGHGGFQNIMSEEKYADLMGIFNDMVQRKHPLALEAKRLAERETDTKTQQLEYLPYLLTLASTQQEMNALQKSAIKRFIDKVVSAVKAWAFDRLGINLNLNENDMVALANRMVNQIGNQAQQNTDTNQNPLYSRSSDYSDITNRISNGLKNLPKTGDWINKKGVDWLGLGLGFLSRRHLTEIYGKLLPQLNKYNELAAQMDADKNDIAAGADNIVHEWSKLKDEEALANVMHDATLAQIDPAKPHQPGDDRVKYQQLLKAYNSLSPESQAMYKKARNAYSAHYTKVHEAIRDRILRSALSSQKKADLLKNIEGSFGQIKGVYFPLARFGEYIIVMRNKNGDVASVSRAETNNQAESIRSELMKKYPQFKVDPVKLDKEYSASRDGVGRGFMSDLFDEVGNLGLDKKAQAEFEDTLSQLYLSSMPDLSWAKHGIHRKGTAGFSQDARRAFAQHMFSGANYLGKLRYGDQLAQQLNDMQKHADEEFNKGENYDQRSAQRVISEMEKRHELLMNPKGHPLSSFLTSAGFMYYLGLSPAAAIVNLSQTALIAYPLMGAKWNYDKAGKELLKASSDFAKGVEFKVPDFSSLESFKNSIGDVYSPNIDKVIKGLELDAYNKAVKRGVIDVTQAHDLAGIAQGEDSKVMWYFRPAMRLASGMFHHAERFNREVTFIAAYRLASQAGASHTEAFDQAMDMVYKGHFDYSSGNRARFMQGNIAKVVLLFKQYAQNMLYTLLRNAHQSIYALDPKDQKEARRALAGILGMHALAAGAIGLPITGMLATASLLIAKKSKLGAAAFGVAALAALASGGDDDDPYELENVIRNWLADIHPTFADLVFGGVPRAFSPVDLSGRVGLNNLIIPDVQDGIEGADWANAYASALLGPVAGIGTNIAKGMQLMGEGHYRRGLESMLPVVIRNPIKAWRYADEGVLAKDGKVIQEDVGGVGLFSQAIGFSPSDVRTSMEGRSAIFAYRNKLSNGRKDLMDVWVNARQEDNSQGMEEAWTEILTYNQKVGQKNPSMRISRIQLMQRYKERERKNRDAGAGGVYLTKRERGAEEQGRFAFDE